MAAGELHGYVVEEINVSELELCDDPLRYSTVRAEPEWQVAIGSKCPILSLPNRANASNQPGLWRPAALCGPRCSRVARRALPSTYPLRLTI
jgi:hypothetical protein